jgi:uncharacterized membrane protein
VEKRIVYQEVIMDTNEGTIDRVVRVILGLVLVWGGWTMASILGWIVLIIGVLLIITGLIGYSQIYKWMKWKTN